MERNHRTTTLVLASPPTASTPCLPGEHWQLVPAAHDSQLNPSTSYAMSLPWFVIAPQHSLSSPCSPLCAALLEQLGHTSKTDAMGEQYKIEFQYITTAFMVMASSKGGHLSFDPRQTYLPSNPELVAFYHACLDFLVKDTWLDAIKAGNCDMLPGLSYSNIACYCPDSDEIILGHLAQMRQNVQSTKPQSKSCPNLPSTIKTPMPLPTASQEVFLHVYPISKLYTDDTGH